MSLGCWAIGGAMAAGEQQLGYAGVEDSEALSAIQRGVDLGVTLFDTADAYGAKLLRTAARRCVAGTP